MRTIIDVVIPTYNPDERLLHILDAMASQTVQPRRVRIVNTDKSGMDALLSAHALTWEALHQRYPFLSVMNIRKEEFDHGATRNFGFRLCEGADFVLTMTQDALPADDTLIGRLLEGLEAPGMACAVRAAERTSPGEAPDMACEEAGAGEAEVAMASRGTGEAEAAPEAEAEAAMDARGAGETEAEANAAMAAREADFEASEAVQEAFSGRIAVSYARQLPNADAPAEERLSRGFNYPETPRIKSEADCGELGIKTYYCSNVCAMYRMDIWRELGGFPDRAIFNEDMIYASKALKAGCGICYAAKAQVYHSHDYTASQQFHRNFDLGVSQAMNPQVFGGLSSEGEGVSYAKAVIRQLVAEHAAGKVPGFCLRCAARLAGYRLGKMYEKLPRGFVIRCSSNKNFWRQQAPDQSGRRE